MSVNIYYNQLKDEYQAKLKESLSESASLKYITNQVPVYHDFKEEDLWLIAQELRCEKMSSYSKTKENIKDAFSYEPCFTDGNCDQKGIMKVTKVGRAKKIKNGKVLYDCGWYVNLKCPICGYEWDYYYVRYCKYCKQWMPAEGECEDECYEKEEAADERRRQKEYGEI